MSVTSAVRKQGVGREGLQPCTCCVMGQQQQPKQKRVSCGMAGWVRLRGALQVPLRGPAQPPAAVRSGACEAVPRKQSALTHVSSVAACSCAQSCAHGKTGVGRPAQPARGMPRAHAAHAPATGPTPPSTVFCDLSEPAADGGCRPLVGPCKLGSRMDAAAKLTGTYLQRPRTPTPPRQPMECMLLPRLRLRLLPLTLIAAGAGLQALPKTPYRTCSCLRTIAIAISSDCS